MATPTPSRQNSRFSSFNVFKLASSSKPPPLPPKDPYFLANSNPSLPSLNQSLSPETLASQPITPLSAQYANLVRSPSPSSLSYTPSRMTMSPGSSTTALSPEPVGFKKGLQKLSSLGRRPKTPKSPEPALVNGLPPVPVDDPSISLPWNFQHNLHIDESCNNLPPTWSARLAEIGLSEEEIAALQARRMASRSPNARQTRLFNPDRSTIIASSFQRAMSEASTSQTSLASSASRSHYRNASGTSRAPSEASSSDVALVESQPEPLAPRPMRPPAPSRSIPTPSESSHSSGSVSTRDTGFRSNPRRTYHIANDSIGSIHSPPPAYSSAGRDGPSNGPSERFLSAEEEKRALQMRINAQAGPSSSSSFVAAAPRLSLHKDSLGDLSSWSESLFSIIPSTPTNAQGFQIASSSFNTAAKEPSVPPRMRSQSHTRAPSTHRNLPPQKPVPLHELPQRAALAPASANSTPPSSANTNNPLWDEVMDLVRPPSSSSQPRTLHKPKSTPALTTAPSSAASQMPPTPKLDLPPPESLRPPPVDDDGSSSENEHDGTLQVRAREKENRDSDISTMTVVPATIMQGAVARCVRGNIVTSPGKPAEDTDVRKQSALLLTATLDAAPANDARDRSHSPESSESRSSSSSVSTTAFGSGSASGSAYTKVSPMPSPAAPTFASAERKRTSSRLDKGKSELPELALDLGTDLDLDILRRPSVLIDDIIATGGLTDSARTTSPATSPARPSPLTPAPRYPGWVSEVVAPLARFIDEAIDPRSLFGDLREIGEGESGSVYAARVIVAPPSASGSAQGSREQNASYVAIKNVPLLPNGSPKLVDLQRELSLMKDVRHENVLSMEAVYVDLVEDGLWIKMELMELSLADVLMLAEEGIVMEEKSIARCTRDILQALSYLQSLGIAHRDLRSDNLLVNREGVVKIADFSSAVQVSRDEPIRSDPAGVIYWQPPEMRMGSYNALKVDVWSLGATVWEMAQAEPPFSDLADPQQMAYRWPPLSQPNMYSRSFHDFLDSCSQPSSLRPNPDELLKTSFVRSASGRQAVVQLLAECRAIEGRIARRQSADSDGTVSVS